MDNGPAKDVRMIAQQDITQLSEAELRSLIEELKAKGNNITLEELVEFKMAQDLLLAKRN